MPNAYFAIQAGYANYAEKALSAPSSRQATYANVVGKSDGGTITSREFWDKAYTSASFYKEVDDKLPVDYFVSPPKSPWSDTGSKTFNQFYSIDCIWVWRKGWGWTCPDFVNTFGSISGRADKIGGQVENAGYAKTLNQALYANVAESTNSKIFNTQNAPETQTAINAQYINGGSAPESRYARTADSLNPSQIWVYRNSSGQGVPLLGDPILDNPWYTPALSNAGRAGVLINETGTINSVTERWDDVHWPYKSLNESVYAGRTTTFDESSKYYIWGDRFSNGQTIWAGSPTSIIDKVSKSDGQKDNFFKQSVAVLTGVSWPIPSSGERGYVTGSSADPTYKNYLSKWAQIVTGPRSGQVLRKAYWSWFNTPPSLISSNEPFITGSNCLNNQFFPIDSRFNRTGQVSGGCGTVPIGGYAAIAGTAVAIQSPSDYRLKTNLEPITDSEERVKQINAYRFNWAASPTGQKVDGFLAHEISQIVPEAVIGEKDAIDENGNPVYQTLDYSKVVPILLSVRKNIIDRIKILDHKISLLES
jgi:hypothetical protein